MTQRQKRWAWVGLALLTLLVLVGLAGQASVLNWGLQRAGVQATGLSGSVWGGLSVAQLRHSAPGWTLEADDVHLAPLRWQSGALQSQVRVTRLRVQSRALTSSAPPLTAPQLLQALDWPTPLRLTQIDIEQLQLDGVAVQALRGSLAAGGAPEALQVTLHGLRLPQADLQVSAELQLQPSGQLRLKAQALRAGTTPLDARLSGDGSLDELPLTLALHGAQGAQAQLSAALQPLAAQPLRGLEGRFSGLDTRLLHPDAPTSAWDGHLSLRTRKPAESGLPWAIELQARNAQALRLDEGGWPLRALLVQLELDPAQWQALKLQQLQVDLGRHSSSAGSLSVAPLTKLPHTGQALLLPLQLRLSDLRQLHRDWPGLSLAGQLTLRQPRLDTQAPLQFNTDVQARALQPSALLSAWRLQAQGSAAGQRVSLDSAELTQTAGPGTASLRGEWQAGSAPGRWQAEATLQVQGWPLAVAPWTTPGRLHANASLALQQGPSQLTGSAALQLGDGNQWAGLPLTGQAGWKATPAGTQWQAQLAVPAEAGAAAPQLSLSLSLSASGSRTAPPRRAAELAEPSAWSVQQLRWQAPQLARFKPWWQPWLPQLAGSTDGEAELRGNATQPSLQALRAQIKQLQLQLPAQPGTWTLAEASASWAASAGRLQVKGLQGEGWLLDTAEAQGGSAQAWTWRAKGHAPPANPGDPKQPWRLEGQTAAPVHSAGDSRWTWPALQLSVGPPDRMAAAWFNLNDTTFEASPSSAALRGGQVRLWGEALRIMQADMAWPQGWPARQLNLALEGKVRPATWLAAADPTSAWRGDMQTDLQLRLRQTGTQAPELSLQGARTLGDLRQGDTPLGLRDVQLKLLRSSAGAWQADFGLQSSVLGNSQLSARTGAGGLNLTGRVQAELGALRPLRPWLPAGLELRGKAKLAATLSGSLAAPHLVGQGDIQIERLQHAASGLGGRNGSVSLGFGENRLRLTQFQLQGLGDKDDGGWLKGEGELSWGGSASPRNPSGSLRVQAEAFRLLNRFDRQLVTTGQAELGFNSQRLKLHGQFSADRGLLDISQGDAPSLDDDVDVRRTSDKTPAEARKAGTLQRDIDLRFNLGQALRLQGRGLASRLMGELRFVDKTSPGSSVNATAQTTGKIELGGGRYKAYGQTLDIESGELRFTGALDNPRLDILALRPDIEARVGVQVTGSAQTPRVRLYSEPDMPDNDKLAWLLLGRAPEELGRNDTALLQRAALALVAGEGENPAAQLMDKLGLTEFSVNNNDDAGTTLRLGAQLGRRWSVAYERSLNSATGSWQLVYRAGQRLRLRAQSGTDSAIDALWLWRYDKL